jgi:pimeloyl-ACP methyl ester carboxylesterase
MVHGVPSRLRQQLRVMPCHVIGRLLAVFLLLLPLVAHAAYAGSEAAAVGDAGARRSGSAPRLFGDGQLIAAQRFSVEVVGHGPDVILCPGIASSREVWRALADKLRDHVRLHLVQVAGFAGEPPGANGQGPILVPLAEAVAAYAATLGPARPLLIGHSMGGTIGLLIAERHPDALGGLLLVDTLPFLGILYGPDATPESIEPVARTLRDRMLAHSESQFEQTETGLLTQMVKDSGGARLALRDAIASDRSVMARSLDEHMTLDTRPDLAKIRVPVVVLYPWDKVSGRSLEFTDALYADSYAVLGNKRLVRVDGALHYIMLDQPQRFAAEVQRFLDSQATPSEQSH